MITTTEDAIREIANELRLLRETRCKHHREMVELGTIEHRERMQAALEDTERRLAAGRQDLQDYMDRFQEILATMDTQRQAMAAEIEDLRTALMNLLLLTRVDAPS